MGYEKQQQDRPEKWGFGENEEAGTVVGQFTVTALQEQVLVSLGEEVELSCQLSPPQSAEHMEIRWFRDRYTQPVHLYKDGKDIYGETVSNYVERTELLKEDIGRGKVTLRILGVRVDDDGPYHCLFQDSEFYDEAITELKVTATSVETRILVHPSTIKGILLECNSEGWFPRPQMEWRDDRGQIISATSESYSRDTDKLFNMKMTLLIRSYRNVTCYLRNSVTGQEEITRIILQDALFSWSDIWIFMLGLIVALLLVFIKTCRIKGCCTWKVPASEPYTQLDIMWLEDVTVVLYILIVFITMVISFIYFKIRGFSSSSIRGYQKMHTNTKEDLKTNM
ncbi:putative selection and upkeep of intraepithelial T-cells protein 1 homolog [Sorex araneus]|uniref:putative selection and upkeep of intraepithelial T-cells protein 1 homolog n=1 Tax=Sorex araneus TaxID=42254 RepID=UPI002433ACC4|nr:putative selection and upkeep of intraepithelial T-cells protein 1 homolog [Sorex araneus]